MREERGKSKARHVPAAAEVDVVVVEEEEEEEKGLKSMWNMVYNILKKSSDSSLQNRGKLRKVDL
jgi:hypothetical protein